MYVDYNKISVIYVSAVIIYKNKYPVNSRRYGSNYPDIHRLLTSIENPPDYCCVCKSLSFNVLQRTSPYTSPRGKIAPCIIILEQSVPWTDGTPICGTKEESVRCQTLNKQQSGGWIWEVYWVYTTSLYSIWRAKKCGVLYVLMCTIT